MVVGTRPLNNSINNRVTTIFGLSEDAAAAQIIAPAQPTTSNPLSVGIGLNSTTAIASNSLVGAVIGAGFYASTLSNLTISAPLGWNYWQALETAAAAGGVINNNGSNIGMSFAGKM